VSIVAATPLVGRSYFRESGPGEELTSAASDWLGTLSDEQRAAALLPYDTPQRVDWHFIPKDQRKGLQLKLMSPEQQTGALQILKAALSQAGYSKATQIMSLEKLLLELEGPRQIIRDPERYYFTLFGDPAVTGRWGLSIEGHHLSLNLVVENGQVIGTTPQVFAANPAVVKNENKSGFVVGTRVLAKEEQLAFDFVKSLSESQRQQAIIAAEAPREIRAAGEPQPPQEPAAGIRVSDLTEDQRRLLRDLAMEYVNAVPEPLAQQRRAAAEAAGVDSITFAWAGPTEPGIGHYYRIQGPTFLIEFVNTQPDAAGNPANHIHSIWRDMRGDFAVPIR
jgi:hypothetical protein